MLYTVTVHTLTLFSPHSVTLHTLQLHCPHLSLSSSHSITVHICHCHHHTLSLSTITQNLFAARVTADILGRLLPKRALLRSTGPLVGLACLKTCMTPLFFLYIDGALPWKSDYFAVGYVVCGGGVCCMWEGYVVCCMCEGCVLCRGVSTVHRKLMIITSSRHPNLQTTTTFTYNHTHLHSHNHHTQPCQYPRFVAVFWWLSGFLNTCAYVCAPEHAPPGTGPRAGALMALLFQLSSLAALLLAQAVQWLLYQHHPGAA